MRSTGGRKLAEQGWGQTIVCMEGVCVEAGRGPMGLFSAFLSPTPPEDASVPAYERRHQSALAPLTWAEQHFRVFALWSSLLFPECLVHPSGKMASLPPSLFFTKV